MFSCQYCKIFKNIYCEKQLPMAASVWRRQNFREVFASGYVHVSAEFIWTGLYLNIYRLQSGYFLAKKEFCITHSIFRSSRLQMFFEIGVHENFANFTGKHLSRSLFLIKLQRLWHRCFPEKFAKFLQHLFYRTTPVTASEF